MTCKDDLVVPTSSFCKRLSVLAKLKSGRGRKPGIKRDKVIKEDTKPVCSSSISVHLKYIEEFGFEDSHFLCTLSLPHVFADYRTPAWLAWYFENMG